ncbi:MAG TPA: hypothetical protein PLT64_06825 [Syntrophales bacterium]|nr:hypothetical protein [Syntrophales bacterium]HOL59565.1 hypothetical protein [Syntrophales bacterium]HPO35655.1 hypothetical protein [Syntrophales bacterium]
MERMVQIKPKENGSDDDLICYCFSFTKRDIEEDYLNHGYSTIEEKIAAEKKRGHCDCTHKHPEGR